jgi:hypothetical protein
MRCDRASLRSARLLAAGRLLRGGGLAILAGVFLACASSGSHRAAGPIHDSEDEVLRARSAAIVGDARTEREKAIRLYRFVRDEIEFGFTSRFDAASPRETLEARRGHCNPQTRLLVALARASGIEARHHFVTISDRILDGVWPERARRRGFLDHSFAELRVDGRWLRLDGYTVDATLLEGARRRLLAEGRAVGYGAHRDACFEWDGRSDCMAQFADETMLLPGGDHGTFEDADDFYRSAAYRQGLGWWSRQLYRFLGVPIMNRRLEEIRAQTEGAS